MNIDLSDIDYLKTTKLYFAIPTTGTISTDLFNSFIKWQTIATQLDLLWSVDTKTDPVLSRAKNSLIAGFMADPRATHLMLLDPLVKWEPYHVLGLLSAKKHIISTYENNLANSNMVSEDNLCEVEKTSDKFLLISKEAIHHFEDHNDIIPFKNINHVKQDAAQHLKTYFESGVHKGKYLDDATMLCSRWQDLGGKIWVDNQLDLNG